MTKLQAVQRMLPAILGAMSLAAAAADIGGWMEHKRRSEAAARDDCPELVALAASTPREADNAAALYFAAGMCHLYSDKVVRDTAAGTAWLTRAAELEHPLAKRALLALRESERPSATTPHPAAYHCHELGMGRRLCHGGPVLQ